MEDQVNTDKDKLRLLGIFPEEIWLMIWESLSDQDDQENFSNCSLFLRQLVISKRTTFLLGKVWRVFGPSFEEGEQAEYNAKIPPEEQDYAVQVGTCDTCDSPRFLAPYRELLKMRQVCTTWCDAIDTIYHRDPNVLDADIDLYDPDGLVYWRLEYFDTCALVESDFQQFYRHFKNTHEEGSTGRSPFPSRALSIVHGPPDYVGPPIDGHHLFNQLPEFLMKYGHHVQFCNIRIWLESPIDHMYSSLKLWLSRMPNLKTLELSIIGKGDGTDTEGFVPTRSEIALLRQAISLNRIPVIPSLEFIRIRSCPKIIFHELIRQNGHVTKLKIFKNDSFGFYDVPSVELSVKNLKEFSTTVDCEEDFLLLAGPLARCPLKKLHLEIDLDVDDGIDWRMVFDTLSVCDETLTDLVLKLPEDTPEDGYEEWPWRLKLHRVTRLELSLPLYTSLDFILPMRKTLQYLDIKVEQEGDTETREEMMKCADMRKHIKFFCRFDNPMESNIWTVFNKLIRVRYFELPNPRYFYDEYKQRLLWSHRRGD